MTVTQDLSFLSLVTNASLLVQLVMALLLLVSVMSWTYIFRKMFAIKSARTQTEEFERAFWSGGDLAILYENATSNRRRSGALARIFESGMGEFNKAKAAFGAKGVIDPASMIDGARRAMRAAYQREMDALESHLAFLASVGSVSPYVGLFGTVWGIMNSFSAIAARHDTTLAVVAPGIAEALFATAMGLLAAIPAVIFYNKFAGDIGRYTGRLEGFADEFSAILSRQLDEKAAR